MAYGKILGSESEVALAQKNIDGFTKLYNETFLNDENKSKSSNAVIEVDSENGNIDSLLTELNSLIGLEKVKEEVTNLINIIKVRKLREQQGLKQVPLSPSSFLRKPWNWKDYGCKNSCKNLQRNRGSFKRAVS